jgi:hypothetical protein
MSRRNRIPTLATLTLVPALLTAACADTEIPLSPHDTDLAQVTARAAHAEMNRDLAALRRATAHLHRFENAAEGGWDLQVTDCKEHPPEGGMGFHFGHLGFYLDGLATVTEPEILLYEPQPSGELRLVAVEYAVPYFAWQGAEAPRLFGRDMKAVDDQGEFQLHVWVWKHNPSGIFEDWNPTVNCDHAS